MWLLEAILVGLIVGAIARLLVPGRHPRGLIVTVIVGIAGSVIATGAFYDLDAPVKRMGAMHVPIPFSPPLEDVTVPTEQTVFEAARTLCGR